MRIWFKVYKDTHLIKDTVIEDNTDVNRTKKVFDAIEKACNEFDLANPIWLDSLIRDFKQHARVRFRQDSFIESIDFDTDAEVICITVETYTAKRAYEIADRFRKKKKIVIMGGYHATIVPEDVKEQ